VHDLQPVSPIYALGPSDEIRLYANKMQRNYTEYATKARIEPPEATAIYSFAFYILYVLNMSSKPLTLQGMKYV
jgi:hypothetical protein